MRKLGHRTVILLAISENKINQFSYMNSYSKILLNPLGKNQVFKKKVSFFVTFQNSPIEAIDEPPKIQDVKYVNTWSLNYF